MFVGCDGRVQFAGVRQVPVTERDGLARLAIEKTPLACAGRDPVGPG